MNLCLTALPMDPRARMNSRFFHARMAPRTIRAVLHSRRQPDDPNNQDKKPPSGAERAFSGAGTGSPPARPTGRIGSDNTRSVNRSARKSKPF